MRVTKADLQRYLAEAAEFNGMELAYFNPLSRGVWDHIRNLPGFVPVCQYGRGMLPLRNEAGCSATQRFIERVRR